MRIEFAGTTEIVSPAILTYELDGGFDPAPYIALGYTDFDVICIGGGGGDGGNYFGQDFNTPGQYLRSYGGKGGGGGFHRIQGLLAALGAGVAINIGGLGAPGTNLYSNATVEFDIPTTDGGPGGTTSFWDGACAASGGEGGSRVYSATLDLGSNTNGGAGGRGASSSPGGGASGAYSGDESTPAEPPSNGLYYAPEGIGEGGGGGAGGVGLYPVGGPTWTGRIEATPGGRGSYDPTLSVYGPGGPSVADVSASIDDGNTIPGYGGGAKATPLNGLRTIWGQSGQANRPGVCVIRLTRVE